jgi:hypothetical protein
VVADIAVLESDEDRVDLFGVGQVHGDLHAVRVDEGRGVDGLRGAHLLEEIAQRHAAHDVLAAVLQIEPALAHPGRLLDRDRLDVVGGATHGPDAHRERHVAGRARRRAPQEEEQ